MNWFEKLFGTSRETMTTEDALAFEKEREAQEKLLAEKVKQQLEEQREKLYQKKIEWQERNPSASSYADDYFQHHQRKIKATGSAATLGHTPMPGQSMSPPVGDPPLRDISEGTSFYHPDGLKYVPLQKTQDSFQPLINKLQQELSQALAKQHDAEGHLGTVSLLLEEEKQKTKELRELVQKLKNDVKDLEMILDDVRTFKDEE